MVRVHTQVLLDLDVVESGIETKFHVLIAMFAQLTEISDFLLNLRLFVILNLVYDHVVHLITAAKHVMAPVVDHICRGETIIFAAKCNRLSVCLLKVVKIAEDLTIQA